MSPELTQAAYRVGDSCTNQIAPLNAYLVIILVAIRRYLPEAGLGTLIALQLPYSIAAISLWTVLLVGWNALGIPLGPS
jgi:aminobenzoyl-glutamate transport protein